MSGKTRDLIVPSVFFFLFLYALLFLVIYTYKQDSDRATYPDSRQDGGVMTIEQFRDAMDSKLK